jgi:epoxyqueuosine reductase
VTSSQLKQQLAAVAHGAGFDILRVTTPASIPNSGSRLRAFLAKGHHGSMDWLDENKDRRADPRVLWPDARSILMLGLNYTPSDNPIATAVDPTRGVISAYARGRDYHDVVKKGLKVVARHLVDKTGADAKVFVDTAPLMEKPLAEAAGIGWQGKHTNLVSRHVGGSWLFLGAILTTADIEPDAAEADHCGSCRRCLDACPTDAFPAPYQLDARRCIAYLTIEHKGPIPAEFRSKIGNRIFGCDDCLAVCPWNKFAEEARNQRLAAKNEAINPPLAELLTLDDATFRTRFAGTPVKRTGRDRFIRNVLVAAGNANDPSLITGVTALLDDLSPLVRGAAVWALARIADDDEWSRQRARHLLHERDSTVIAEWTTAPSDRATA